MISWLRKLIQSGDQVSVSPKKIIVGLGNPGLRYVRTLHNAGFLTVDRIAGEDVKWKKWRNLASICIIEVEGVRVFLVKPSTYMNLSGKAVQPLLRQMGLLPQDLLVIHDDMDLPAGKISLTSSMPSPVVPGECLVGSNGTVLQFSNESMDTLLLPVWTWLVPVVTIWVCPQQTIIRSYITPQIWIVRSSAMHHNPFNRNFFPCFIAIIIGQD
jgi:hypothetical protein